jgi:hypothetical protein
MTDTITRIIGINKSRMITIGTLLRCREGIAVFVKIEVAGGILENVAQRGKLVL